MSGQQGVGKLSDIQGVGNLSDVTARVQPGAGGGAPYTSEEFSGQSAPEGSASGRFLSNAGAMLNPLQILAALGEMVTNPTGVAQGIGGAMFDQGQQAIDAAKQGRYSEAAGHGGAAMLPIVGPLAAGAGQQIASGDIAGGLGTAAGLLAPAFLAPGLRIGLKGASALAPEAVANALDRGAAARVTDVMSPKVGANKVRFGNQAAKVAPELLKNDAVGGLSREGFHSNVQAGLEAAKQDLDTATDSRLASQQVPTKPVLAAIDQQIAQLTAEPAEASRVTPSLNGPGGRPTPSGLTRNIDSGQMQKAPIPEARPLGQSVEPAPNAAQIDTLRKIRDEVSALGPTAPYESLRRIRQAWDTVAKPKYMPATAQDALKGQGEATGAMKGTGAIRDALASSDPATAEANAKYSLYKTADDILQATKETERSRPKVGRQIMARLTGSILGSEAAGPAGAVGGYVLGPVVDSALSAGVTTKLVTARLMSGLADAIRTGDASRVNGLIAKLQRLTKTSVASQATSPSGSQRQPGSTPLPLASPSGS